MDLLNEVSLVSDLEIIIIYLLVFVVGYVAGFTGAIIALAKRLKEMG